MYFQGAQLLQPVASGVHLFGVAFTVAPAAIGTSRPTQTAFQDLNTPYSLIACGILVAKFNRYLPENFIGWIITTISFGIMSMLTVHSPKSWQIGFQIVSGIGLGLVYAAPTYPILAPLPITKSAHAIALFAFVRTFAQAFGVTIGSTILQNELRRQLPKTFLDQVPGQGAEIAYAVIPMVGTLEEPLRGQVRDAFAGSVAVIWKVMIGGSVAGFLCVFGMKEIKMAEVTDEDWGMADRRQPEGMAGTEVQGEKA